MATKKQNIDGRAERRFYNLPVTIEKRDGKESRTIVGYAAVFNKFSDPIGGWFREKIDPGAFDNVLNQDTVCLFNHDSNLVLARNNKTLVLSVDDVGLQYRFEAPNTTAGNDLLENIGLGNIVKSSFAFTTKRAEWAKNTDNNNIEEDRTIMEIENLIDVSPVTFAAYPDAVVAKREYDVYCTEHREAEEEETDDNGNSLEILNAKLRLRKHTF